MEKRLLNKRAFVTGGSRGIGAGIVKRLAAEGAQVAFTYANSPDQANAVVKAAEGLGVDALAIKADSADAGALVAAVDSAAAKFGGLDILVNSAGIIAIGPVDTFKLADFDRMIAVNVRAAFVAAQAALKYMKAGGRIINVGSCNAERMPFAGGAVYAMTKSALVGLVKGMARDLGARGITVNNIQPGPVNTDGNPDSGEFAEMLKQQFVALHRYASVEEVAGMVAYLAGPEAGYITGASLTIDGGFNA